MTPAIRIWGAAAVAAFLCAAFAWFVRLPLPFTGFSSIAAAVLAASTTLAFVALMPRGWVWTDTERLRHAFQARHGVSGDTAQSALQAITTAHSRADALRHAARAMRDDTAAQLTSVADRMDAAAREIFYAPKQQRDLRAVLVRSELIEDAANAHAALRGRNHAETEDTSRQKLLSAVDALNAAFDQTDLAAARGLLMEVEAASDVAETVLAPRGRMAASSISTPTD